MPLYAPWPISTCFAITVTLSSAPTRRNAFGANVAPGACAAIARRDVPAHSKPIVSANARVGRTAADVAAHRGVDIGVGRLGVLHEQRSGGHDLPGLTVAALRHL